MNRHKGEIAMELDRPRVWRLRWKDIAALEERLSQERGKKVNWMEIRSKFGELSIGDMAVLVWAGLRHEDPDITPDKVLEIADYPLLDSFMAKFAERMMDSVPESMRKNLVPPQAQGKNTQ